MNTEIIETAEVVATLETELSKADITREFIRARGAEYAALTIDGPSDSRGLEVAKKARRTLVSTRTAIEEKRKELNEDHLKIQRQNNAAAKTLIALIEEYEQPLDARIKEIEAERESIRAEKERAEAARIQARIDSLTKLGMVWNGMGYDATDFDCYIDGIEVQALPDEEWQDLYEESLERYQEHQAVLKQQREQAEAEAKRQEQERQAEADRLQKQADEQQAEAKRQQDEAKRLADEREEINQLKLEARQQALQALGFMATQGDSMRLRLAPINFDRNIPNAELLAMSTDDFNGVIANTHEVKAQSAEALRQWSLYVDRLNALANTGVYIRQGSPECAQWIGSDDYLTVEQLAGLTDEQWGITLQQAKDEQQARIVAAQKVADDKAKVAADEAKAKQKADKERTARLKGDKKLMKAYVKRLADVIVPTLEDNEAVEFQQSFLADLLIVLNNQLGKIDAL